MSRRVIVVGSINADLVIRSERLPSPGETVTGGSFERHHGGKGGNQAVAAARLGVPVAFVGAVGDDPFGIEARAALVAEGIDVSELVTLGRATGVALILVDRRGENLISVASGANAALEETAIGPAFDRIAVGPGDVVLVCNEVPTGTVREALRAGRARGARTVLNPAPADGIDRTVLAWADVLSPNQGELLTLAATDARRSGRASTYGTAVAADVARAARTLLEPSAAGPGAGEAVAVTLGPVGALLVTGDSTIDIPSIAVEALDTTGAGDAFNGALAAALAEDRPIEEAVRRAVVAGAIATTRVGAREGMPTAAELATALGD